MSVSVAVGVVSAPGITVAFILLVEYIVNGGSHGQALYSTEHERVSYAQVAHEIGIEAVCLNPRVAHVLLAHILRLQCDVKPALAVCEGVVCDYLGREREPAVAVSYLPTLVCVVIVQYLGELLYAVTAQGGVCLPTEPAWQRDACHYLGAGAVAVGDVGGKRLANLVEFACEH